MKIIHTRAWLAAAIAAGLLAGCSHNDNNTANTDNTVKPTTSTSSAPYNPKAVNSSQIPPQFPQQGLPGTGQSGAPTPKQ